MYLTPCEIEDRLLLRIPRPRLGDPESRALRPHTEPDAHHHHSDLIHAAARAHLHPLHADDLPN